MRFLLYIVICAVGLLSASPAFANKSQLPHKVTLKLNQPDDFGQPLTLTTELGAVTDFYKGSVSLVISAKGGDGDLPIKVFSGDGNAGFSHLSEVELPPLVPGRYKVHALFTIYLSEKDTKPIRSGSNLYLDVSANRVLSSTISYSHIKQLELKAVLAARDKRNQSNDMSSLKTQDPALYQKLNTVNQVQAKQNIGIQTIKALPGSVTGKESISSKSVNVIEISSGQQEVADPRKRQRSKSTQLDRQNALLETQADEVQ